MRDTTIKNLTAKPIQLIVPARFGSNIDVQARLLAETAQTFIGNSIEVINKPGKATVSGVMEVLKARADGYTLVFIIIPTIAIQPYLHGTPYTHEDLTPVANLSETYIMLYSRKNSPWQNLNDLIIHAKKSRVKVSCTEIGLLPHLAGMELEKMTHAEFTYFPCKSSEAAIESLIKGNTDAALALSSAHTDTVEALAIFEPERKGSLPHVSTAMEQGYNVVGYVRDGIAVKKGTPKEAIVALGDAFKKALETDEIQTAFYRRKTEIKYLNSEETQKLWISAVHNYRTVIDDIKHDQL